MSFLNVNVQVLAYADGPSTNNPAVRLADLKWSMLGMPSDNIRNAPINLAPGETMTIASTARLVTYSSSTSFAVTKEPNGRMRISVGIGQRTSRDSGDSTTSWDLTKNGSVVRLTAVGGTLPNLSATQPGDSVNLKTFAPHNNGIFVILSKGANYVEFVNQYAANEAGVSGSPLSIYSNGPVQIGDIIDLTSPSFAFPNQGAFPIVAVTDGYIEVANPNAFDQTVSGLSTGVAVYPYAYKWMLVAVDRKVTVGLNGSSPTAIEVEPPVEGDLNKNPGLMLKRGKVYEVQIMNTGPKPVSGFLLLGE